jgi:hypothetical protein
VPEGGERAESSGCGEGSGVDETVLLAAGALLLMGRHYLGSTRVIGSRPRAGGRSKPLKDAAEQQFLATSSSPASTLKFIRSDGEISRILETRREFELPKLVLLHIATPRFPKA